jgi:hypothetical protein
MPLSSEKMASAAKAREYRFMVAVWQIPCHCHLQTCGETLARAFAASRFTPSSPCLFDLVPLFFLLALATLDVTLRFVVNQENISYEYAFT